ncbi:MAG: C13 family peptidase, partial [Candidatus Accumulibacter sp.]|nr:C13 family peptidase [Accumulibacter sp.]
DLPDAAPTDRACARSDSLPRDSAPSDPKATEAPEQSAEITSAFARRRTASVAFVGQLWRVLTFRRPDPCAFRATPLALLLPIPLFFLLLLIPEIVRDGWPGEMEWSNASGILLAFAFMALMVGFAMMLSDESSQAWNDGGRFWLTLNWLLLLLPLVSFLSGGQWYDLISVAILVALFFCHATPAVKNLRHTLGFQSWLFFGALGFALYLACVAAFSYETRNLWTSSAEKARWAARRQNRPPRVNLDEDTLFTQPRLLDESIAAIAPGTPGRPEIFFLGVAGYTQQVFLNEIRMAQTLLIERFGAQGRTLLLANNVKTAKEIPFANRESLRRALSGIARRMNPEDTLFLFMTSHGSRESGFSLLLQPLNLTDISPETLRELLDASGIKRRVVVVSGCYSGQFIPALQNDDSLVITASSADRTSFGCGDDSEFTDFGRAYFIEALNETRSFTEAFRLAAERIAQREKQEERTPSLPQIARGKNYREVAEQENNK